MYGFYTKHKENNRLDVAIVEASAITEDGGIIPGASVGASPEMYVLEFYESTTWLLTTSRRLQHPNGRQDHH